MIIAPLANKKKNIYEYLEPLGFKKVDNLSFTCTDAIATKSYKTAVGEKNVVLRLGQFINVENEQDPSTQYVLKGEYQSEGRNIIEHINSEIKDLDLKEQVNTFVKKIEEVIDLSYARKLNLKHKSRLK